MGAPLEPQRIGESPQQRASAGLCTPAAGSEHSCTCPGSCDSEGLRGSALPHVQIEPAGSGDGLKDRIVRACCEVSSTTSTHYLVVIGACVLYGLTLVTFWVIGWLLAYVQWMLTIPPSVGALVVWVQCGRVHSLGPTQHAQTTMARAVLTLTVIVFTYVTLFPIFVSQLHQPFASQLLQICGSASLAFAGCVFMQTPIILLAERLGVMASSLSLRKLLWQAALRTSAFIDCWTDFQMSVILFSKVRSWPSI